MSDVERTNYDGGVRDTDSDKPDLTLLYPQGVWFENQWLTRVAREMTEKAKYYGARNWEAFQSVEPLEHAKRSLARHVAKLLAGDTDEDHLALASINLLFIHTIEHKMNLADTQVFNPEPQGIAVDLRGDWSDLGEKLEDDLLDALEMGGEIRASHRYGSYAFTKDEWLSDHPAWVAVDRLARDGLLSESRSLFNQFCANGRCECCCERPANVYFCTDCTWATEGDACCDTYDSSVRCAWGRPE